MIEQKIGFVCKYYHQDRSLRPSQLKKIESNFNSKTLMLGIASKLCEHDRFNALENVMRQNIESLNNLIDHVSSLPSRLRMFRISSDILPLYTVDLTNDFWSSALIKSFLETEFSKIREKLDRHDIKVSFHPGQYTVLSSTKEHVVTNAIREIEYHTDMARWMNFGRSFQDGCKINVHIGGQLGPDGIISQLSKLSPEGRNLLTIENDEVSWGIDETIKLKDHLALVLDVHHHWVKTGEYIEPADEHVQLIEESWRGIRPTLHFSTSREDVLPGHSIYERPSLDLLLKSGIKRGSLRAHSLMPWNLALNSWILRFNDRFDIMVEAKAKNVAALCLDGMKVHV